MPAGLIDLGTLPGYQGSIAFGLNDAGEVVGDLISGSGQNASYSAFLYRDGTMTALPVLPGGLSGEAFGINDAGQVVGYTQFLLGGYHAFLYSNGALTDLGTLGGTDSMALAINGLGQIVGSAGTAAGVEHAFLYSNGKMTDLGTLPDGVASGATGINNAGQVVGWSETPTGAPHAFLYSNGKMTDLGTLGGTDSEASGINDAGQVVGDSSNAARSQEAFLYSDGKMTDLGSGAADGINDAGQVVGSSDGIGHAFFYENGMMTDLGTFPGGTYSQGRAINSAGQVAGGSVTPWGDTYAFLDTPSQQTITFGSLPSKTYGNSPFTLGATATSGLPITYTILSGPATVSGNTLTLKGAGSVRVEATQPGNGSYLAATPVVQTFSVKSASTSTSLTASLGSSEFGEKVTITARVRVSGPDAATPTGTVSFRDGDMVLGTAKLNGGVAVFHTSKLTPGSNHITAVYGGSRNNRGSTSTVRNLTVTPAKTRLKLTASPDPAVVGQTVSFQAQVKVLTPGAGVPRGRVTFMDGSAVLGSATLSDGIAVFRTAQLKSGRHKIKVIYAGDADFGSSTSAALTEVVG